MDGWRCRFGKTNQNVGGDGRRWRRKSYDLVMGYKGLSRERRGNKVFSEREREREILWFLGKMTKIPIPHGSVYEW